MLRLPLAIFCAGLAAAAPALAGEANNAFKPSFNYRTTWVGNSQGGKDGKFVQMDARCLFTAPDGTCYLNVPWEEGGSQVGVYRDGQVIGSVGKTHGWGNAGGFAVVASDKYLFIAQKKDSEGGHLHDRDPGSYPPGNANWYGISRRTVSSNGRNGAAFEGGKGSGKLIQGLGDDKNAALVQSFLVVNEVVFEKKDKTSRDEPHLRGLAYDASAGRLYVSNPYKSEILVFDAESMKKLASWPCPNTRQMAADPKGNLWVVQAQLDQYGRLAPDVPPAKILCFDKDGKGLDTRTITSVAMPTGLAFDPQGRLLVADNGTDQQVKIFRDIDTTPTADGAIGVKGGILADVPGKVQELKFHGLQGVGCDSKGNVYVVGNGYGGNGSGLTLEAYSAAGKRNWALYGLEFVDAGDFDPASDGQVVIMPYERFAMDYTRTAPGDEWSYKGFTMDRNRYPMDPRMYTGFDSVWARRIGGKLFMFMTDMYSGKIGVFRFNDKDEIAAPCGLFIGKPDKRTPQYPPGKPAGRFIWVDRNGDGQFDADEFDSDGQTDPATWAWHVDSKGDVWQGYQNLSGIRQFVCQGLNDQGVPVYSRDKSVLHQVPAPFTKGNGASLERVLYVPEQDVMYLAGYTQEQPNPGGAWKCIGRVLCKYEKWSTTKEKVWEAHPRFKWSNDVPKRDTIASFCTAGEYVFLVDGRSGTVLIHSAATGEQVGTMPPGAEVGNRSGWVDIPYGINAIRRSNGEYVVIVEEDERAKNIVYRFRSPTTLPTQPDREKPAQAPDPAQGRGTRISSTGP